MLGYACFFAHKKLQTARNLSEDEALGVLNVEFPHPSKANDVRCQIDDDRLVARSRYHTVAFVEVQLL